MPTKTISPDPSWHEFTALVECLYPGTKFYGVFAPYDVAEVHGSKKVRIVGEMMGEPIELAFNKFVDRGYYLYVNQKLMKQHGLALGDKVHVRYQVDDPNRVDIPEELAAALALEEGALAVYEQLTPGRRRGMGYYIRSAKNPELRIQKSLELVQGLLRNGLTGWPAKGNWDGGTRRTDFR